jgi:hypothetical protein
MSDVNSKNKEYPLLTITEIRLNKHIVHLQCEVSRSSYKLGFSSCMWHCVNGSVAPYIKKNHSRLLDPSRWRYHDPTDVSNDSIATQLHFSEELDLQQHSCKVNVPNGYKQYANNRDLQITIFTRMQDNSNLRWPPNKTCLPRENVFQIQENPPKWKSAKKKHLNINFIHLKHKACS